MAVAAWDMWKFKGDEARLIRMGEELPNGWFDSPGMGEALRDPLDHDGDGRKGGSLPAAKRGPGRPRKVPVNV